MKFTSVILLFFSFFYSGCAVGPLVNHETARTVGNSNHELIGGYGQAGYVLKWSYGLTENLDLGLHWESFSLGYRLKYAFQSKQSGGSLAFAAGQGASIGGSHYYGDIIASYLSGSWEPYSALRVVHVKSDGQEVKSGSNGDVIFKVEKSEFDYGQFILGSRYWFNKHWLFSLEASTLFAISSSVRGNNSFIASGSFGYRF